LFSHFREIGREFGGLSHQGAVQVVQTIAVLFHQARYGFQHVQTRYALIGRVGVREMLADIPQPQGAEVVVSYPFVFDVVGF